MRKNFTQKTIHMSITINFILIAILLVSSPIQAQTDPILKFNDVGKFKIVQFTDIHLKIDNPPRRDSVLANMKDIIASEKPDLVILTGDVVTSRPVPEAWANVTKPMIDAKIPWAVVFGNHDHEHGLSNKEIMDYLVTLPFNVSKHGPENISGCGNYVIEINGSFSSYPKALLYCFDSNAYTSEKDNDELGKYDWIKNDQIQWYRNLSKSYTEKNKMQPYPALAFFHIPLPEYDIVKNFETTVGVCQENISSPNVNSGMYNAFLESGDVMGTFCGHDHVNDFIGTFNNIALAFGCKTGLDSYGKLGKGGRIIVLYEGVRKFETWIHNTKESKKYFVTYPDSFPKPIKKKDK
ncbi:MAG: metallophosphoesterase family protein [Melioribacteraceae bacterium]